MTNISDRSIKREMDEMVRNREEWIERIREVSKRIFGEARISYELRTVKVGGIPYTIQREHSIIIESEAVPEDELLRRQIINEIYRDAGIPFYSPFKIILRKRL